MFKSHSYRRLSWPGCIVGVSLNVYAQYNQYLHHSILGNYRSLSRREKGQTYFIPFGHWFEYVSCPHYLAEILIYASFAILLHPSVHDDDADTDGVGVVVCDANRWIAEICFLILPWRHVVLLLWVAINVAVSAQSSHGWYQNQFKAYPKNRCALIPFLWWFAARVQLAHAQYSTHSINRNRSRNITITPTTILSSSWNWCRPLFAWGEVSSNPQPEERWTSLLFNSIGRETPSNIDNANHSILLGTVLVSVLFLSNDEKKRYILFDQIKD